MKTYNKKSEHLKHKSLKKPLFIVNTSRISSFYRYSYEERLASVIKFSDLTSEEAEILRSYNALDIKTASMMIENVLSVVGLPMGIATNFQINNIDYFVPMATEEPSVVAAASNAAKLSRASGGFFTKSDPPIMTGQVNLANVPDSKLAITQIIKNKIKIINQANSYNPKLIKLGGGVKNIEISNLSTDRGNVVVVNFITNVQDAMGANIVNTIVEKIAPTLEKISGGKAILKIVSNLATKRLASAKATWLKKDIGSETIESILDCVSIANASPFRASTHNKGIMNGIDAIAIATGNDFRAIEAGAHCFAVKNGSYQALSKYYKDKDGNLVGQIELPIAVGTVGGSTKCNPIAKIALKILKIKKSSDLAQIMAAVGLAQNFAALYALTTKGIQRGHMKLHRKKLLIKDEINNKKKILKTKRSITNQKSTLNKPRKKDL
jgi:hydroxymethylglutaryl-CoA reductase